MNRYAGWDWMVRLYYADDVKPPKVPGELALETIHKGDASKNMEVSVAEARPDIGRIEILSLRNESA